MWLRILGPVVAALAILFSAGQACKCHLGPRVYKKHTYRCCMKADRESKFNEDKNDCVASSISESLARFSDCCYQYGDYSDCSCPSSLCTLDRHRPDDKDDEDDSGDEGDENDDEDDDAAKLRWLLKIGGLHLWGTPSEGITQWIRGVGTHSTAPPRGRLLP